MTNFMVSNRHFFLIGKNSVFLLVACNDYFNGFFQVSLGSELSAITDCSQSCLVNDIRQFRTGGTRGHTGNHLEVHIVSDLHFLGMYPENLFSAVQVRQFYGNTAVETSGTGQCRVKGFGTVGCRQDHNAGIALKAVHFRQQLVQGLLPLVVSAHTTAGITLLADGVDLVNKHDTGSLFLCLLKQVTNLACTHTDKHLHELRAGDGKERYIGFTGNCLCQHGLAGTGRAYKKNAFGHGSTDFLVLAGVMEVIHNFRQTFLGLVHALHIGKADAIGGFDIDLGIGFAHIEGHGIGTTCFVHHFLGHELSKGYKNHTGQNPGQQKTKQRRSLLHDFCTKVGNTGSIQPFCQIGIFQNTGLINLGFFLVCKHDLIGLDIHSSDILLLSHGHKGAIINFLHPLLHQPRHGHKVEQRQNHKHNSVVINQWLPRLFYLIHTIFPFCIFLCLSDLYIE